jgi:hypothetical protein
MQQKRKLKKENLAKEVSQPLYNMYNKLITILILGTLYTASLIGIIIYCIIKVI